VILLLALAGLVIDIVVDFDAAAIQFGRPVRLSSGSRL